MRPIAEIAIMHISAGAVGASLIHLIERHTFSATEGVKERKLYADYSNNHGCIKLTLIFYTNGICTRGKNNYIGISISN